MDKKEKKVTTEPVSEEVVVVVTDPVTEEAPKKKRAPRKKKAEVEVVEEPELPVLEFIEGQVVASSELKEDGYVHVKSVVGVGYKLHLDEYKKLAQ